MHQQIDVSRIAKAVGENLNPQGGRSVPEGFDFGSGKFMYDLSRSQIALMPFRAKQQSAVAGATTPAIYIAAPSSSNIGPGTGTSVVGDGVAATIVPGIVTNDKRSFLQTLTMKLSLTVAGAAAVYAANGTFTFLLTIYSSPDGVILPMIADFQVSQDTKTDYIARVDNFHLRRNETLYAVCDYKTVVPGGVLPANSFFDVAVDGFFLKTGERF